MKQGKIKVFLGYFFLRKIITTIAITAMIPIPAAIGTMSIGESAVGVGEIVGLGEGVVEGLGEAVELDVGVGLAVGVGLDVGEVTSIPFIVTESAGS